MKMRMMTSTMRMKMVGSTLPRAIASELSLDDESVEPSWSTVTVKVHDAVLPASSEATSFHLPW